MARTKSPPQQAPELQHDDLPRLLDHVQDAISENVRMHATQACPCESPLANGAASGQTLAVKPVS